jgi:DNA repair protein RAD7
MCSNLTNQTVLDFFSNLKSQGLRKLNLCGLVDLQDDAVIAAIHSCGHYIQRLNLNGCDNLTDRVFKALIQPVGSPISSGCSSLEHLDISWIRAVDDEVLKQIIDASPTLKRISVYGCNRLTHFALDREWKTKNGHVIQFDGNEFD